MNHVNYYEIIVVNVVCLFSISIMLYRLIRSKTKIEYNKVINELSKEKEITTSIHKINHELKNPLAICSSYLKILPSAEESKKEQYLNIINEEINRGLTIIKDLANIGKEANLEKEELDLASLFEDVKNTLNPLYQEQNGEIIIPNVEELYIKGNYDKLKEALINILKNSLEAKTTNSVSTKISIRKVKSNYKISIKDNGKGMTKEELSHIYEMFYTTKINGTGIGIPLIKEIIDLHNGKINYTSEINKGTTVIITLPI